MTIAEAYCVQDAVASLRANQNNAVVGYKVGCTSRAIRTWFELSEPIMGRLYQAITYPEGSLVIPGSPAELIQIDRVMNLRVEIENIGSVNAAFSN